MFRNYWASLAFANLVYLRAWSDLLPIDADGLFYRKTIPGWPLYFAVALDVLALSLLTQLLVKLAPKMPGWLQRGLVALGLGLVLLALGSVAPRPIRFPGFHIFLSVLWLVACALIFRYFAVALRAIGNLTPAAVCCLAVTFAGSPIYLKSQTQLPADPALATTLPGRPPVRVLWIVFDEWDENISFTHRDPSVHMPVIDRLATRSFTAAHALAVQTDTPIAQMATQNAIPSLLYGRVLVHSEVEDAQTRGMDFADRTVVDFGSGDSIFHRIRAKGWNASAAGWYVPYCRVFNPLLTGCYWDQIYEERNSSRPGVIGAALDETRMLFETQMFSIFGPSLVNIRHRAEYEAILAAALHSAADPSIGLAFVHFNIPHVPYFYDPKVGRFGHYGYSDALYNQALERVDHTVGELLDALNRSGLAAQTAIIMTSDHPQRSNPTKPYVPFLVHLPGEIDPAVCFDEFTTGKTADLVMAIASGTVKTPADVQTALGIFKRN